METLSFLIPIAFIIVCSYEYFFGKVLDIREKHMKPVLSFQCGGSFGWGTNISYPLVRQTVYEKFLVIGHGNTKYVLDFDNITLLTKPPHIFSQTLRFHHNIETLPKRVSIHTTRANEILELLKKQGVNVENV